MVDVQMEVELLVGKDIGRIELAVVKISIERTVSELTTDILDRRHVFGEQVDGAAKGGGSNCRGGAWAAGGVDAAEELGREKGPPGVGGGVGVVEEDAVEDD